MVTPAVQINNGTKTRNSNLELYRIIVMLLIVAHHYVVNSGLQEVMSQEPLSGKSIFLYLFGIWGKTGINCFVLITGYFMCKSSITVRKFLKLLLEVEFYKIFFYAVFVLSGYEEFSLTGLGKALLPVYYIADNFTGCFLLFYLCIPFLSILVQNLDKKRHIMLIGLCLFIYTLFGTLPRTHVNMNYISWFSVLFVIASYVRIHGLSSGRTGRRKLHWGGLTIICILLSMASVIFTVWLNEYLGMTMWPYRWVQDSNTFLALATALCSFMYFKDLNIRQSRLINAVGGCTFGVLLIHANSDTMRQWLWKDVLDNVGHFTSGGIVIHALLSVAAVFAVCVVIDYIRQRTLEKWTFKYLDKILHNFRLS